MPSYQIPEINIPVVPVFETVEPPTRGMEPPITRGINPPDLSVPNPEIPTVNLLPPTITNPDPGTPGGGPASEGEEEEQTEEDTRDMPMTELPMAPFDASTQIQITVPIIEQEYTIPVPKPEVVITAGTTAMTAAVTATGAAVFAKPLFEQVMKIMKPLVKKVAQKLFQKKEKKYPPPVECTLPDQFQFSSLRPSPLLSRQHRDRRKEKKGAGKPPSESSQYTSKP